MINLKQFELVWCHCDDRCHNDDHLHLYIPCDYHLHLYIPRDDHRRRHGPGKHRDRTDPGR